jgi:endoglucanase
MLKNILKIACISLPLTTVCTTATHASTTIRLQGVNFSGAEFGGCTKPAKYGYQYGYPKNENFDVFLGLGMNAFRLPFCWERLQPSATQALDDAELTRMDATVNYATARGAYVILDPHNYASYQGKLIGAGTTNEMFADFWSRVAAHYRNNDHVIFGLMNEPHGISSETWLGAANAAIAAIRSAGAKNLILVPGTAWTGAHSWSRTSYGTPNAVTMLNINDPINHYAYEVHQYFDTDSSGTKPDCVSETVGAQRIVEFTAWAKANKKQAVLGEFGAGKNDVCYKAVYNTLAAMQQNPDVWIGWTYWSTGSWVQKYMFALPLNPTTEPSQLDVLKQFLPKAGSCGTVGKCNPPSPPTMINPN